MSKQPIHPSVTMDRVVALSMRHMRTLDNPGLCLHCGEEAMDCEPDAREYECESCGECQVYGADELLIMGAYNP
jgi:hypothetical protein